MFISWKDDDASLTWPLTFEQKVELFYDQAVGWQLHIADLVANGGIAFGEGGSRDGEAVVSIRHSGFAVLQICLSYLETVGNYTGNDTSSKAAFRAGAREVFPELGMMPPDLAEAFIDSMYKDARCGLYHNVRSARVGLGTISNGSAYALDTSGRRPRVVFSPERLPKVLLNHLEGFRERLLNPTNSALRTSFERAFDRDSVA
jgi:hypothetical protein